MDYVDSSARYFAEEEWQARAYANAGRMIGLDAIVTRVRGGFRVTLKNLDWPIVAASQSVHKTQA